MKTRPMTTRPMKALTGTVLLLAVLAASAWALALRDVPAIGRAPDGTAGARGAPSAYPGAEHLSMRRVVAEGDGRFWPAPDGARFTWVDHAGDLAILDLRTGESRPAPGGAAVREGRTGTPGYVFLSRMSPDGRRIAYQLNRDGLWAIRVVDLESGAVRDLVEHPDPDGWVDLGSWSPDGQTIAVALLLDGSYVAPGRIALVRVDDGSVTDVAAFDARPAKTVTFSPDGQWLAYQRVRTVDAGDHDLFLRSVQGGRELRLTRGPGDHQLAGWLPGGGPLFYLRGDQGRYDLRAVKIENGRAVSEPRLVRSDLWHAWPRGFSENAFFFVQMPERLTAHTARIDPDVPRLTSPLTPIVPATSMDWTSSVAWSANGDRMAYMAGNDLVIRSLATGAERRIPTGFSALGTGALVWSPTVDRVAIQAADFATGTFGIHVIDLSDGTAELVIPSGAAVFNAQPRWSPDGQALFVSRRQPDHAGTGIVRVDLQTRTEREVYRIEEYGGFALHPDGRHLAVGQRAVPQRAGDEADRVLVVPIDGGEPRELLRIPAPGRLSRGNAGLDWSLDGRYLLIGGDPDAEHRRTIWIADHDGARLRELATFVSDGGMQVRPRFHPGGREISVVAGRNRWEIWTLDNLRAEPLRPDR
jgi:Tol biopolymer transport system component